MKGLPGFPAPRAKKDSFPCSRVMTVTLLSRSPTGMDFITMPVTSCTPFRISNSLWRQGTVLCLLFLKTKQKI